MDLDGSSSGLIEVLCQHLPAKTENNLRKTPAEIRNGHSPNRKSRILPLQHLLQFIAR